MGPAIPFERFHAALPMTFRMLTLLIGVLIFGATLIYGLSVYIEHHVLALGKETRTVQEDNQDLQITLDRLRAYQKVGDASAKIQGLQMPTDVITIASRETKPPAPVEAPLPKVPKNLYGY